MRWVIWTVVLLGIGVLSANLVLAPCGGPFDPPCFVCDNTVCEASVGENCNSCPEDCGCTGGLVCTYVSPDWICQEDEPCDNDCTCDGGEGAWCGDCTDEDNDGIDGDTVAGCGDICPGTPFGQSVNDDGCSCSQLSCGSKDCDYLDGLYDCRNYHDVAYGCSGGHCHSSATCDSWTNTNGGLSCSLPTAQCSVSPCVCQSGLCTPVGCQYDSDCPADGWVSTGNTRTVLVGACGDQSQHEEEFQNHYCSNNQCILSITSSRWVDDGNPVANNDHCTPESCVESPPGTFTCTVTCIPNCDGANCNDPDGCGGYCDGPCPSGVCVGDATGRQCVECTNNNHCDPPEPYCVAQSCVACRNAGDCTNPPAGSHPDCISPSCSRNTCSYPSTNGGGSCGSGGTCAAGACVTGCQSNPDCNDYNVCTTDTCTTGTCTNTPITNCCHSSADCDDEDICTTDSCSQNACTNSPIANCCHDDNDCALGESCVSNACVANCVPTTEVCDGVDNDCNDVVDEGCDLDDDDYCAGSIPPGYSCLEPNPRCCTNGGLDCNDAQASINPGMGEVCNDVDDDCDDLIDEADPDLPDVLYQDLDNDGYGNPAISVAYCDVYQSGGFASSGDDCDDQHANANPGIPIESGPACFDNLDNDCDTTTDGLDPDCFTIECGGTTCEPYQESTTEWRSTDDSCSEAELTVTSHYIVTGCVTNECTYGLDHTSEEPTGATRPLADGTSCTIGYCLGGTCAEECSSSYQPGCQPSQPPGATTRPGGCPTALACYQCPEGWYWSHDECKQASHYIEADAIFTTAGTSFLITPTTYTHDGEPVQDPLYRYAGFRDATTNEPLTITTTNEEVGTHELQISSFAITAQGEEPLAMTTIEIGLTCPDKQACCPVGSLRFSPEGTPCDLAGTPGSCDDFGVCQPTCSHQVVLENSASKCSDGIDNNCNGILDCIKEPNGATEKGCTPYCSAFCERGRTPCNTECVDPANNRNHCGGCNVKCATDEQCTHGVCTKLPGCFVACQHDQDCGENQACILSGTCDAYCEDHPVIQLNETATQELLTSVIRQKTYEITKTLDQESLTLTIKNLITTPLENFTMTITVPKGIAESASEISSDHEFAILHDDPVVKTTLAAVANVVHVTYYFTHDVDVELLEYVVVTAEHAPIDLGLISLLAEDDLVITRAFHEDNDGTTVTITLTPGQVLENVRIPLEIPKCLAHSISELIFDHENYVVVNDDPLMVWTFDELSTKQTISFTVPKTISQDCRSQLSAFGMASGIRKPVNPWLPVAIIPVIGFILVFFQRFHQTGAERHMSKKEFYEDGRRLGQSEEQINKAWAEYKRRF